MAHHPGTNPFHPLIIGAIAVVVALAAFLIFREGTETTQQAGIGNQPPAATSPAPGQTAPPKKTPATPPAGGTQ